MIKVGLNISSLNITVIYGSKKVLQEFLFEVLDARFSSFWWGQTFDDEVRVRLEHQVDVLDEIVFVVFDVNFRAGLSHSSQEDLLEASPGICHDRIESSTRVVARI